MFERWDCPLAQTLTLRDGRILRTLADARDVIAAGRRTALNADVMDDTLCLLDEAAHIGGTHAVERATDRAIVALMVQRHL